MALSSLEDDMLHSMAATLASYDDLFDPHHPLTLAVMRQLGRALCRAGDTDPGTVLLERVQREEIDAA